MSCAFHAFTEDGPCPWCAEAAGNVLVLGEDKNRYAPSCTSCESRDVRRNEFAGYTWCGACGRRS